jgi:DNA-binding beta-propeller fold protein YncE
MIVGNGTRSKLSRTVRFPLQRGLLVNGVAVAWLSSLAAVSRRSRLRWIFAGLLLAGLAMAVIVAEAGAQKGSVVSQIRSAVSVIDTATNRLATKAIKVGPFPSAIALSPTAAVHTWSTRVA